MSEEITANYRSPVIRDVNPAQKRLIDTGMLHFESSVAGYNERYHRGETSHTIHVWWARRPHSAMRALVFSSLCKSTSNEALDVLSQLAMGTQEETISTAKKLINDGYSSTPKLLDMFGGGGTIAFEAKRLGVESYSIDSNQLSAFIQMCNMVYADRINLQDAENKTYETGIDILTRLKHRTDWLYPLRRKENEKLFGYIWTYKTSCPECGRSIILSKRPWLSKKNGRRTAFISQTDDANNNERLIIRNLSAEENPFQPHWESRTGSVLCPKCGHRITDIDILQCEDLMTAYIKNSSHPGKEYSSADQDEAIPSIESIYEEENRVLKKLNTCLPTSQLPVWSGVVNPALYGIKTHSDVLNARQRLLLLYLIDELTIAHEKLKHENEDLAKFTIGALSGLIDQVIDWNCRLSMWISQNEQVGRGFCGPGIAMLFDYAETDQLLDGPANLWDKLKRICNGIHSFEQCSGTTNVEHAYAQHLPYANNTFDAIVTDPPYYDNIYYSILADFFYSWKKILLRKIEPELFAKDTTDYDHELVASSRRVEDGQSPHEVYCEQLNLAFQEASRVLKDDGVFSFVYSHSSVNGWEAVIRAYRHSNFFVNSVQPLSIERKGRPRAVLSQAINTCVTIVARKESCKKLPISLQEILTLASDYCNNFGSLLIQNSGWCQADAGLAVIACIVGNLANASAVSGVTDTDALLEASKVIKNHFPEFSIKIRDSL